MTKPKLEMKHKVIAGSLIVTYDKKTYTLKTDKTTKDLIREEIEKFNKLNSESRLKKIIALLTPKETKKKEETTVLKKKAAKAKKEVTKLEKENKSLISAHPLREDGRFDFVGEAIRLKGYSVDMPAELVAEMINYKATMTPIEPLINFWMLAMLNPNPIARDKMFAYLTRHKLVITPNGYFVTYRMVKKTQNQHEFAPAREGYAGPKMVYVAGSVARMPRHLCDEDGANDCSRGLHTGTPDFIGIKLGDGYAMGTKILTKEQGGGQGTGYNSVPQNQSFDHSFGNQAIICLVNPMHVVSVPVSDTRKMRSCEFFFAKLTTPEEVIQLQTSAYHIFDHDYHEFEQKEILAMLANADLKNIEKKGIKNPSTKALEEEKVKFEKLSLLIKERTGDPFASTLTPAELKSIIQSRIKKK